MKKYFILTALAVLLQTAFSTAAISQNKNTADTLQAYTGRFQIVQSGQIKQVDIEIENGELVGTDLHSGQELHLVSTNGNYTVKELGAPIKFIKDKNHKVVELLFADTDTWKRIDERIPPAGVKPNNQQEYVGKYQLMMNGQAMVIEITVKHGKLWGIPLFGGPESPLDYVSGDDYTVNTTGWPMKFIRDKDKKISQMLFNAKDLFTRIN